MNLICQPVRDDLFNENLIMCIQICSKVYSWMKCKLKSNRTLFIDKVCLKSTICMKFNTKNFAVITPPYLNIASPLAIKITPNVGLEDIISHAKQPSCKNINVGICLS